MHYRFFSYSWSFHYCNSNYVLLFLLWCSSVFPILQLLIPSWLWTFVSSLLSLSYLWDWLDLVQLAFDNNSVYLALLVAIRCTFSNLYIPPISLGFQTCTAYSRWGLIKDINSFFQRSLSLLTKVSLSIPNTLFALLNAEIIYSFQLKLDGTIIPRCLSDSVVSKILYLKHSSCIW